MRARTVLYSLALLALCFGRAEAEPLKVRVAWVAPLTDWASIWLEKKDLARHYGKSYLFEAVHYAGTPPMITAMANNELEIGSLAYSTLPIAIANAGMDDMRVLTDVFQDGAAGYYSNEFDVLADSPIKTVEDLKGKIVAINAQGSAVDVELKAMLHKHGLEPNRDYTVVEAPFPAMLAEKKVDLISAVRPFSLDPELKKIARTLFTSRDAIGPSQYLVWNARKPFIDSNRAVLVDLLEDSVRIVHWYLDPKNHDAAAEIAGRLTKQPADRFGWLFGKEDYYHDPDMMPKLDVLQKNVDITHELGFTQASVDIRAHSDLSLLEEALKRLK
ncbi:MAG: ABC transporter substrate-binding protein [Xanthobacteraceae bacterium]